MSEELKPELFRPERYMVVVEYEKYIAELKWKHRKVVATILAIIAGFWLF